MEVIRLDSISLWRRTQEEFSYDLKRTILALMEGKFRKPKKKLVLNQVDLSIQSGEKIGVIGANGAGKSTLLKVISGILHPTSGAIRVRGKIAPLIELGAGFIPSLSVLDNINLYGVLLGRSRSEMALRSQAILDFAELQDWALAPVKALSSGMAARLGFAIATDQRSDILILDEVFAVGDERFRQKCKQRIDQFWHSDTTVLVVSHEMNFILEACERVIWLDQGKVQFTGSAMDAVELYLQALTQPVSLSSSG
jgi:ABC-type polysaccharide/polyol phosphate transport system ATPase subunit